MGKATGFLEYSRVEEPFRPEAERLKDFAYLHAALPAQARREQGDTSEETAQEIVHAAMAYAKNRAGYDAHSARAAALHRGNALRRDLGHTPAEGWHGNEADILGRKAHAALPIERKGKIHILGVLCHGFRQQHSHLAHAARGTKKQDIEMHDAPPSMRGTHRRAQFFYAARKATMPPGLFCGGTGASPRITCRRKTARTPRKSPVH